MSTPYTHGKFVWFEHMSPDTGKARAFYNALFGWSTNAMPMGAGEPYPMILNGGEGIGGYRQATGKVATHWVAYLSVPDVDASFKSVSEQGCRTMLAPTDFGPGRAVRQLHADAGDAGLAAVDEAVVGRAAADAVVVEDAAGDGVVEAVDEGTADVRARDHPGSRDAQLGTRQRAEGEAPIRDCHAPNSPKNSGTGPHAITGGQERGFQRPHGC